MRVERDGKLSKGYKASIFVFGLFLTLITIGPCAAFCSYMAVSTFTMGDLFWSLFLCFMALVWIGAIFGIPIAWIEKEEEKERRKAADEAMINLNKKS